MEHRRACPKCSRTMSKHGVCNSSVCNPPPLAAHLVICPRCDNVMVRNGNCHSSICHQEAPEWFKETVRMVMEQGAMTDEQVNLRARSGNETTKDPLVSFLYELMRDHVTPGVVEEIMTQVDVKKFHGEVLFTNGYLAKHAKDLADRLRAR